MNQKTALLIAAGVTSFMLALGGGAAVVANRASVAAEPVAAQPASTFVDAQTTSADMSAQREAQYVELINQANNQIKQANSQIKQANTEITSLKEQLLQAQTQATAQAQAQAAPQYITADQAQVIALNAVPGGTVLRTPDLVDYLGTPAYEVVLDKGTLYIDATTGAILANGAALPVDAPVQGERHHEHESGGDD